MPERVFADTNVFLRYLTKDVPARADAVDRLLERAEAGELVLVVSPLVIAEIRAQARDVDAPARPAPASSSWTLRETQVTPTGTE